MIRKFKFFEGIDENSYVFSDLNFTTLPIGQNRTLRTYWTDEMSQDLNFYHGIDAEAELTRIMSEEISRSVDEEIIQTITRRINGGNRA
jgi:hypothetical protein